MERRGTDSQPVLTMPLTDDCKEYIGRDLIVVPYYGHGWIRPDLGGPTPEPTGMIGPSPFHFRMDEVIFCSNNAMGAGGVITEPDHPFNGHWCGLILRRTDECDFTSKQGDYMVWICQTKLPIYPASDKALYEWVSFDKSTACLCGYGLVAETVDDMGDTYDRVMATRKTLLGESK
jgi:hypothetical protein